MKGRAKSRSGIRKLMALAGILILVGATILGVSAAVEQGILRSSEEIEYDEVLQAADGDELAQIFEDILNWYYNPTDGENLKIRIELTDQADYVISDMLELDDNTGIFSTYNVLLVIEGNGQELIAEGRRHFYMEGIAKELLFTLEDVTLVYGAQGGGIEVRDSQKVILDGNGTTVLDGSAGSTYATGGGISITSVSESETRGFHIERIGYADAESNKSAAGGGIYYNQQDGSKSILQDVTIYNNYANNGAGIEIEASDVIELINCRLLENTTVGEGGGIRNKGKSLIIRESEISGNVSNSQGAGIYSSGSGTVLLQGVEVRENTSSNKGGGIFSSGSVITIEAGSEIVGNKSAIEGGGVYTSTILSVRADCSVTGNYAESHGGGIWSSGNNVTCSDSLVSGNTSGGNGGGIYSGTNTTVSLTDSAVRDNAALQGGGLYITGLGKLEAAGEATVSGNKASGAGGGVYMNTGSVTLKDTSVIGGNTKEDKNEAVSGGGIYVNNMQAANGHIILDEQAAVSGNKAASGGGIYFSQSGNISGKGTINGNEADNGGAVYQALTQTLAPQQNVTIAGITIADNHAKERGGGIYVTDGNLALQGTGSERVYIQGNYAGAHGGGIYDAADVNVSNNNRVSVAIESAQILDNTTEGNGGGYYTSGREVVFTDTAFTGNTAGAHGGAIGAPTDDNDIAGTKEYWKQIAVDNGSFENNSASTHVTVLTEADKAIHAEQITQTTQYTEFKGLTMTHAYSDYDIFNVDKKYQVYYDLNYETDDKVTDPRYYEKGSEAYVEPENPSRSGYEFLGWSEDPGADAGTYDKGDLISGTMEEDITLYAIWRHIPDVSISKSVDKEAAFVGDTLIYKITLSNADEAGTWKGRLQDVISADLKVESLSSDHDGIPVSVENNMTANQLQIEDIVLAGGEQVTITISGKLLNTGTIKNTAEMTEEGSNIPEPSNEVETDVYERPGELEVTKDVTADGVHYNDYVTNPDAYSAAGESFEAGNSVVKYWITIQNTAGNLSVLEQVVFTDRLPYGMKYVSGSFEADGVSVADSDSSLNIEAFDKDTRQEIKYELSAGSLNNGECVVVTFLAEVTKEAEGDLDNIATVTAEVPSIPGESGTKEQSYSDQTKIATSMSNYQVEYYFAEQTGGQETYVLDEALTDRFKVNVGTSINGYEWKNVAAYGREAYMFVRAENFPLIVSETEADNVIKVYYKLRSESAAYRVNVFYDGVYDKDSSFQSSSEIGNVIDTYTLTNVKPGYVWDRDEFKPLTIVEDEEKNVINVYYMSSQPTGAEFTFEYYYDGVQEHTYKVTGRAAAGTVLTEYPAKPIRLQKNYTLESVSQIPFEVTADSDDNIIRIYYVSQYEYSYEYYYDGVQDSSATITSVAKVGTEVSTYPGKPREGYRLHEVSPDLENGTFLTVSENAGNNVIRIYYVPIPDVKLEKSVDKKEAANGDTLAYKITARNTGTGTWYGELKDIFPAELEDIAITGLSGTGEKGSEQAAVTGNILNVTDVELGQGEELVILATAKIRMEVSLGTEITNTVTGEGSDQWGNHYDPPEEESSVAITKVVVRKAELQVSKQIETIHDGSAAVTPEDKTAEIGDIITYAINVENAGVQGSLLTDIEVTDELPVGLTLIKDSIRIEDDNGDEVQAEVKISGKTIRVIFDTDITLAAGESITIYMDTIVNAAADGADKIENKAVVDAYSIDEAHPGEPPVKRTGMDLAAVGQQADPVTEQGNYTVEYYFDGVRNDVLTDSGTALLGSEVTFFTDKVTDGYTFHKAEGIPLTISKNEDQNVIRVYYTSEGEEIQDEIHAYRTEYFYDDEIDTDLTEYGRALAGTEVNSYVEKLKDGYELDKTEGLPLMIAADEERNVIRVYYVAKTSTNPKFYDYTIEYYYDGIKDENETITGSAEAGRVIDSYVEKLREGYELDRTEGLPLTIVMDEEQNTIRVYYKETTDPGPAVYGYTVEYYYDGVKDQNATVTGGARADAVIDGYVEKLKDGYELDKTEGLPLTIAADEKQNVIRIYYKKIADLTPDVYAYTIEYYYDGVKDQKATITGGAEENTVINSYMEKLKDGYELDKTEGLPLTITADEKQNVIRIYYVKKKSNSVSYYVQYYYDGVMDAKLTDVMKAAPGTKISTYTDKNKTGYVFQKTENLPLVVSSDEAENVIKVYYQKKAEAGKKGAGGGTEEDPGNKKKRKSVTDGESSAQDKKKDSAAPETGDLRADLWLWIVLAGVAIVTVVYSYQEKKR